MGVDRVRKVNDCAIVVRHRRDRRRETWSISSVRVQKGY